MQETNHRPAPQITLSIVTYNSEKWLAAFFQSLFQQNLPCDQIALCVLDNGSTDNSFAWLSKQQAVLSQKFASLSLNQGQNIGFGLGHNFNLALTNTPYFWVTNVDLEFEPDSLTTLLATAQQDSSQAFSNTLIAAWECRQKPYEHPKDYHPVTGETAWCSSACVLFKTDAIQSVKGYDPLLFLYGEDVELSYRLRRQGYKLKYVPQATVWHYTYEEAAQVKPQQFLGSTLANVLLRCRYGRRHEVIQGFVMFMALFAMKPQFPGMRTKLLGQLWKLIQLAPKFLSSRQKSKETFPFRMWDYAMAREGAFYEYPNAQNSAIVQAEQNNTLPWVSVLVRTMPGRSGKLKEALAGVAHQTYARIELVVVEDGGQDVQSAKPHIDALEKSGVIQKIVYRPLAKVGRCEAGNQALAAATGQLCCFLDDDDLFYADHLEVLVNAWLNNTLLGAVYSLAYEVRTEVISEEPWVYKDILHNLIHRQPFNRGVLWHHNYFPIQAVLFQRQLFLDHGGFDTSLDNLEDWNLWVRYSLKNDFELVPKVTSLYRVPNDVNKALQRQSVLDDYYAKAQAKHAELRVELSPTEIIQIAQELSRQSSVVGVPMSLLKRIVLGTPGLRNFYHPLKRLASIWRRMRS
jgi:glycosyltransferase involved in cell wall biosynthesis